MKRFSNIRLITDADTDHAQVAQRAITLAKNNQAALTIYTWLAACADQEHR